MWSSRSTYIELVGVKALGLARVPSDSESVPVQIPVCEMVGQGAILFPLPRIVALSVDISEWIGSRVRRDKRKWVEK